MELFDRKESCFGCGACAAVCPRGAVEMRADEEGFPYPYVDGSLCSGCGSCGAVCPAKAPMPGREGRAFAVRCGDPELLLRSSSGGAFSLLAGAVLREGGLVCGARFDGDFRVVHELGTDIGPMRKSKYVQSDASGCFGPVRDALDGGRAVLFSGTPCQCHAMRLFAGDRPGLILVSLICRGVMSPGLWADYAAWLAGGGRLEAFDFRDKRGRNDGHIVSFTVDGRETASKMDRDPIGRLYMRCLGLRPSCHSCPYSRPDTDFDFTIGDFWGVGKSFPELDDGMGVSLVIARSGRAAELMELLGDSACVVPCDMEQAMQPALAGPVKPTVLRKLLMRDFARKGPDGRCDMGLILKKYAGV